MGIVKRAKVDKADKDKSYCKESSGLKNKLRCNCLYICNKHWHFPQGYTGCDTVRDDQHPHTHTRHIILTLSISHSHHTHHTHSQCITNILWCSQSHANNHTTSPPIILIHLFTVGINGHSICAYVFVPLFHVKLLYWAIYHSKILICPIKSHFSMIFACQKKRIAWNSNEIGNCYNFLLFFFSFPFTMEQYMTSLQGSLPSTSSRLLFVSIFTFTVHHMFYMCIPFLFCFL